MHVGHLPALNVDLAWTPFCVPKLGGHATHAAGATKLCSISHPDSALGSSGLDSLVFTESLDLTALDPYGDQNLLFELIDLVAVNW